MCINMLCTKMFVLCCCNHDNICLQICDMLKNGFQYFLSPTKKDSTQPRTSCQAKRIRHSLQPLQPLGQRKSNHDRRLDRRHEGIQALEAESAPFIRWRLPLSALNQLRSKPVETWQTLRRSLGLSPVPNMVHCRARCIWAEGLLGINPRFRLE